MPEAAEARPETPAKIAPDRALPDLESVVARIPPELAGLLDDLFRARFTAVRRLAPQKSVAP